MGKVVKFEIPARDLDRAKKFYSNVFGWEADDQEERFFTPVKTASTDESGEVRERGAINGVIVERNKSAPCPVISILVDNLDESVKEIVNAGGKLIEHKKIIGDMAHSYFRDPEDNVISVVERLK